MAIIFNYSKQIDEKYKTYENIIQTPRWLAKIMIEYIPKSSKKILDPTAGNGNIADEAIEYSQKNKLDWEVCYSYDFFETLELGGKYDCIVMNPPFSKKNLYINKFNLKIDQMKSSHIGYYILKRCMNLADFIICVIPWYFIINSSTRTQEILEFGTKEIINLPRKTFKNIRVQTCLLILENGYSGKTIFGNLLI